MITFTWRALVTAFALLYTLVSLQACSAPLQDQPVTLAVSDLPETETVIINILQSREEISRPLQQAIELYAASVGGAHINVQTVANQADYRVTLRSKLLAGEQVDIFQVFSGREARELEEYLADLSGLGWVTGAAEQTAEAVAFGGKLVGIPYSLEGYGLLANRDIFEVTGIPLGEILTFEDLAGAFAELDARIDDGTATADFPQLRYVTELPLQDKSFLASYPADLLLRGQFATPAEAAERYDLSLPGGEAAQELYRLLLDYGPRTDWEARDSLSWQSQVEAFADGQIAVLLGDTECYRQIVALNPAMEDRVALLPIPIGGADVGLIGTGAPLYWAVSASSSESARKVAEDFLTWLYQSEQGTAVLASRFGVVSPYLETGKETGLSTHRQMLSYIGRERTAPSVWREVPAGWGADAFAAGLRSWVTGDVEWEQLLDRCREAWAYGG